jgi:hypothetical protein
MSRARSGEVEGGAGRGQLLHRDRAVGRQVLLDPAHVAHAEGAAGHHVEAVFVEPRESEIGLDTAALVAELGIDQRAFGLVEVAGGQPLQVGEGAGPRDLVLGEGTLVDQHRAFARGAAFVADRTEPVGPALEGGPVDRVGARRREPVGPFPAEARAEHGILRGQ